MVSFLLLSNLVPRTISLGYILHILFFHECILWVSRVEGWRQRLIGLHRRGLRGRFQVWLDMGGGIFMIPIKKSIDEFSIISKKKIPVPCVMVRTPTEGSLITSSKTSSSTSVPDSSRTFTLSSTLGTPNFKKAKKRYTNYWESNLVSYLLITFNITRAHAYQQTKMPPGSAQLF